VRIPLAESATGVLNAAGRVSLSMGPAVYGSYWSVERISVSCTSATDTDCTMYRQIESPTTLIDATSNGNSDTNDSSGNPIDVKQGQSLVFVWTGGVAGAVATVVLDGTKETGR